MRRFIKRKDLATLSASEGSRFSTDGMHRLQLSTTSQRHQIEYFQSGDCFSRSRSIAMTNLPAQSQLCVV
jgi:hypothetical protein